MRKGAKRLEWTTDEITQLIDMAGRIPAREIRLQLKKSKRSLESMVHELRKSGVDITLRCFRTRLKWCNRCSTYRTYINDKTGHCRVCATGDQLQGREAACADALTAMPLKDRLIYEESEAKRQTRRLPVRPKKMPSQPCSMYERRKAEEHYLIELERWEYQCKKLQYDAAKTRLRRMREKSGTNPRKNSK